MRFSGRKAIITGGSQGIGEAVARRVAAEGAVVVVVASSDMAKAKSVADSIIKGGGKAVPAIADVRNSHAARELADAHADADTLVNCAGVFYPTPTGETRSADVDRIVDINLKGTFHMINAVTPRMKARGFGKIVNFASVAGLMGIGGYGLYCATKAGIVMMTRALAVELAPFGINVNAIAPGNTATTMNADIRMDPNLKGVLDFMASRTPSGRTYSQPEEMAGIAAFLLSDDAKAMHGSTVLADEGFSAGA